MIVCRTAYGKLQFTIPELNAERSFLYAIGKRGHGRIHVLLYKYLTIRLVIRLKLWIADNKIIQDLTVVPS